MRRKSVQLLAALAVTAGLAAIGGPVAAQQREGGQGRGGDARGGGGGGGRGRGPQTPPLLMTTMAFEDGGVIPAKYVGAMGVSPELKWTQVPMGTQSFVLLFHDPEPVL